MAQMARQESHLQCEAVRTRELLRTCEQTRSQEESQRSALSEALRRADALRETVSGFALARRGKSPRRVAFRLWQDHAEACRQATRRKARAEKASGELQRHLAAQLAIATEAFAHAHLEEDTEEELDYGEGTVVPSGLGGDQLVAPAAPQSLCGAGPVAEALRHELATEQERRTKPEPPPKGKGKGKARKKRQQRPGEGDVGAGRV